MNYLLDTDIVVNWLNNQKKEILLLKNIAEQGLAISIISYGEIYEGIYYGQEPENHERIFLQFLRWVDVVPLNKTIMKQFARTRGHLRSKGLLIGDTDILIAATAITHDLILVTNNTRHFNRIPELHLFNSIT